MKKYDKVSNFTSGWWPYLWIVLVGLIVYGRAFFFGFTYLDDNVLILDNIEFLKNLGNIPAAFHQDVFHVLHSAAAYYRPMLTLSFMFDAQLGGANPFVYHISNVAMHLISAILLYKLLVKLSGRELLSLAGALVFTVHPVSSLAVAFVPGRNDPLMAIFAFLSFIWLIDFVQTEKEGYYAGSILAFALAMFTKESAIGIIPLSLLYLLIVRREKIGSFNQQIFAIGWIVAGAIWWLLRRSAFAGSTMDLGLAASFRSIWLDSPALIQWLGKIFFPVNLSVYPIIRDTSFVYGVVALILSVIIFALGKVRSRRLFIFGLLWYLIFIVPSLVYPGDTYVGGNYVASEHRNYVPLLGLILAFMEVDWKRIFRRPVYGYYTFATVVIVLSVLNIYHTTSFKDRITFWTDAVKTSPHSPLTHRNLGAMYYLDGKKDEAAAEYQQALELNPSEAMAHNNLGLIYMDKGDLAKAEGELKEELENNPSYDNAYYNLGLVYYREGKKKEAYDAWLKTLQINPESAAAYNNAAAVAVELGDKLSTQNSGSGLKFK